MVANQLREVQCPTGPLGLVMFDTEAGVRVGKITEGSKLLAQVVPGDILVSINGEHVTSGFNADYVAARLKELSGTSRTLVFRRSGDCTTFHDASTVTRFESGGGGTTPRFAGDLSGGVCSPRDRSSMDSSSGGSSGSGGEREAGGAAAPLFSRAPSEFKSASRRSSDSDLKLGDLSTALHPEHNSPRLGTLSARKRRVIAGDDADLDDDDIDAEFAF